ncbi:hypothetical protein ACKXKM_004600 [Escherichia coli]
MESARDKRTGEIVEAEDLWLLDSVDTEGYVDWPPESPDNQYHLNK